MSNFNLNKNTTGLLIVDVQEKLFPKVQRPGETLDAMQLMVRGAQALKLPIVVCEQYPKGLGATIPPLRTLLGQAKTWEKTAFSALGDPELKKYLLGLRLTQWIVIGIEAHVCVQQSVRDLCREGLEVVVLNDAISSRSIYDYSTAIGEMRDAGARVSSVETVLFEMVHDARAEEFSALSALVKGRETACCGC